tara:strand:+ start:66 stop:650 length:585 start_codon:yes stop_codon:yes gene_type:complete
MLFILAFLLINPPTKKADIPAKAEIMVVLDWEDDSKDDLDLWIKGDNMPLPLSFQVKNATLWHLDRDDLGVSTDVVQVAGETMILRYNREVATMRGLMQGDFHINVHVYSKKDDGPTKFSITVIDINPYKEIYKLEAMAEGFSDIIKFPAFTVGPDGEIIDTFTSDKIFAAKRGNVYTPDPGETQIPPMGEPVP